MKYLTTKEIAEKWNISDRRVRALAKTDRLPGTIIKEGEYLIPENLDKPFDGRTKKRKPSAYLKYDDTVIAEIHEDMSVFFIEPNFNETVKLYTAGSDFWNRSQFEEFLSDRLVSPKRRDIEKILFKLGFSKYRVLDIAFATRAINSADLIWIAFNENEKYDDAISAVFSSIFSDKKDLQGDSVDSPEGMGIKRYGVFNGNYGIYKNRLNPLSTDIESEVAVYKLANELGVQCCPAYFADENTIFSQFMYDIPNESIVHFRRLFDANEAVSRSDNEYRNLIAVRPQYQKDIIKMIVLDFITRQDDRHLSNIALKISSIGESFYPLYDNGRSLFYEDSEETANRACLDIKAFSTCFGPSGSYWDYIKEISEIGVDFSKIVNLELREPKVRDLLISSNFKSYRLEASCEWICKCIEELKKI